MHIDIIPNRGSRPAYLLRESFREGQRGGKHRAGAHHADPELKETVADVTAV